MSADLLAAQLCLPSADELESISKMRAALPDGALDAHSEDVTSDVAFCRFLRGHSNNQEKATQYYEAMLLWRKENEAMLSKTRATFGSDAIEDDPSLLPHAEKVLPIIKMLEGSNATWDGLPISAMFPGFNDLEAFSSQITDDEFSEFVTGMLEQRFVILHRQSLLQKRMVKYVEVRELDTLAVSKLLGAPQVLMRVKRVLGVVQDMYPELIHQVLIFNAPATFNQVFKVFSAIMNERMRAKIVVVPVPNAMPSIAAHLPPPALHMWARALAGLQDKATGAGTGDIVVPAGQCSYRTLWVSSADGPVATVRYSVNLTQGSDLTTALFFLPCPAAAGDSGTIFAAEPELQTLLEGSATSSSGLEGTAECKGQCGVCVLMLDNSASWFKPKAASFALAM